MKKFLILVALLSISSPSFCQNPNPNSDVDDYILDEMDAENAPGMATLIVKGGEIVWVESYGWADVQNSVAVQDSTVFLLASVSKVFTGTALMLLHESGQIDLDADINNYLPFTIDVPNFVGDSITPRMLMTHTASIADNETVMDTYYSTGDPTIALADVIERYFSTTGSDYNATANFLNNAPGTTYEYSNIGTALAGYVVEAASGMDFSAFCNQHIFNAICMENTAWYYADFDSANVARPYQWDGNQYLPYAHYGFADYPNGQLRSNVLDLANFLITYLQNGSFNGNALLTNSSVSEMLSAQVPSIEPAQGLNWYTEEIFLSGGGTTNLWGHNGGESGVSTDIYINPSNGIGIAVLSNGEGDNLNVVDELYNYALTLNTTGTGNPPCNALGIREYINSEVLHIYPNPSNGIIHVENKKGGLGTVNVFNSFGQLVYSVQTNSSKLSLELETAGIYSIRTLHKDGTTAVSKVVVQ